MSMCSRKGWYVCTPWSFWRVDLDLLWISLHSKLPWFSCFPWGIARSNLHGPFSKNMPHTKLLSMSHHLRVAQLLAELADFRAVRSKWSGTLTGLEAYLGRHKVGEVSHTRSLHFSYF